MKPSLIAVPLVLLLAWCVGAQAAIFRPAVKLPSPVNHGTANEVSPELSQDLRTLYFSSNRSGGLGGQDVWKSTRADLTSTWSAPTNVKELNSTEGEWMGGLRADGCEVIFASARVSNYDLFDSTRAGTTSKWATPRAVPGVPSANIQGGVSITGDGLDVYFHSASSGQTLIYRMTRTNPASSWSAPVHVSELTVSGATQFSPAISSDGLSIIFSSNRLGGFGNLDFWYASRTTRSAKFGVPFPLREINSTLREGNGRWTSDGFSYYFAIQEVGDFFRADRILPICIPTGLPTRGQPFDVACRRDPGDTGIVIGSLWKIPATKIPRAQGMLNINPVGIIWQSIGVVGNMGRFTTRLPIPKIPALQGIPLHWQAAAQDPASKVYISPLVTTVIQ